MSMDVEETMERLRHKKGVIGVIIVENKDGRPVKSTFDQEQTTRYADVLHPYTQKSREAIRELDPTNDLTYIRLRSKKHEIMIAPDKDYTMAVVQNANP